MRDGIFLYSSCGSPYYAAPELIIGKFYNGASIDIWSSGVILYAILTGTLPFDEEQIPKLYQKIKECKYSMPPTLSDEAKDLIFRMLQLDPMDRITIPEIKNHRWFKNNLPLYVSIDNYRHIYFNQIIIDEEIIDKILTLDPIYATLKKDEVRKAVINREKHEFCVLYELLENINQKKLSKQKEELLDSKFFN